MTSEIIVHGAVKHLAVKPMPCTFPYFANKEAVLLGLLHLSSEIDPEGITNLAGNIQPPSVDIIFFNPISSYTYEISLDFRIIRSKLRHHPFIAETLRDFLPSIRNHHRVLKTLEPRPISGGPSIFDHIFKSKEMPATMVEHSVDYDSHPSFMYLFDQGCKLFVGAEDRIYIEVIDQIIFMVLSGDKNRIKIDGVEAQILDIIQVFSDTFNISSPCPLALIALI